MSDLISRQAVIEALGEAPEVWTDSPEDFAALTQWEMDVTAIMAVPPAEPKTGKWIKLDMHAHLADHKCTSCGQECYVPTCMGDPMYDFCPHCGAKMVREDGEA